MEEKLYFRPAKYGKGLKKHKEKSKEPDKAEPKKDSKNHRARNLILFLLFLAVVVVVIVWLLRGEITTSGQYPENIKNYSLSCTSRGITPEKLASADSADKELKINAIFNNDAELKNISLIYTTIYASESAAYSAEAHTHADLNHALSASGYNVEKFSNKFSRYGEKLIISLYALQSEIDEISAPYFLIPLDDNHKVSLKNLDDYKASYESLGFTCNTSK